MDCCLIYNTIPSIFSLNDNFLLILRLASITLWRANFQPSTLSYLSCKLKVACCKFCCANFQPSTLSYPGCKSNVAGCMLLLSQLSTFNLELSGLQVEGCMLQVLLRELSTFNLQPNHPTLPSSDIANNFCASTANSMGNLFSTSFA
jgi:hypothetical protein